MKIKVKHPPHRTIKIIKIINLQNLKSMKYINKIKRNTYQKNKKITIQYCFKIYYPLHTKIFKIKSL